MAKTITGEFLWRQHRAILGGKSAITGAALPETLGECVPAVRASHWGMALAVCLELGLEEPPVPDGVTAEDATRVRQSLSMCSTA